MADKSTFSADEWEKIVEAPMLVTVIMFAVGQHGPLSMVKESTASAKAITSPGNRGSASGLIAEIVPDAKSKQARHDAEHHSGSSMAEIVDACLVDLQAAATALKKLPGDEAAQVGGWFYDVAAAVAAAAKGTSDAETEALGRIATTLGVEAKPAT
jgi:hypothetical protein